MKTKVVSFQNKKGEKLSARLELPIGFGADHFAIFAHCFTCGKNARAATIISRQLTLSGFAVLRFDFTGLGQSEGDFGSSGFTSNIEDLVSAADFLKNEYKEPSLLIGHSLGGTAVLHASAKIDSIKALCTIGAPFESAHVKHLLSEGEAAIKERGRATVNIGGRPFDISAEFLDTLEGHSTKTVIQKLKKSLLVMHSPQDTIVGIDNAADIYTSAFHPKSFVSLDGADHLLTNTADAVYAASIIGSWTKRYLDQEKRNYLTTELQTVAQLGSDGFTTEIVSGAHYVLADEPKEVGGNDLGASPYQLLNASLGACTAMTLKLYAERKKWNLEKVTVHLSHNKKHAEDINDPGNKKSKIDVFKRLLEIEGDLDVDQKQKLLEIANKCPVHRTLTETEVVVETELK